MSQENTGKNLCDLLVHLVSWWFKTKIGHGYGDGDAHGADIRPHAAP